MKKNSFHIEKKKFFSSVLVLIYPSYKSFLMTQQVSF